MTCLWFNSEGEEAAKFYVSLFKDARILRKTHYGKGMPMPEGAVLTVDFVLEGREFMALNGGMDSPFTQAHSMVVICDGQEEVDRLWAALGQGGKPVACGWITDRYGLSWQIVPRIMMNYLSEPDAEKRDRVMAAMMQMV